MENLTISQISKMLDVTPRMLRHYEKLGLLTSLRREDNSYRIYDEGAVRRLQQIVILRKLRIPLKQIAMILQDTNQLHALEILQENLEELEEEAASLNLIKKLLKELVLRFDRSIRKNIPFDMLEDSEFAKAIGRLALSKTTIKENTNMSDLNKANEILDKSLNVRIILLPPCTVAAYQFVGENPEEQAGDVICKFVQESGLYEKKPDSRYYGFNHPDPEEGSKVYGYESWVTIPEDMEVPEPLVRKHFPGGLYAAYTINFPDFFEWRFLYQWAERNEQYEAAMTPREEKNMGGALEEHLNWVYCAHAGWPENGVDGKLDLLLPIRRRNAGKEDNSY